MDGAVPARVTSKCPGNGEPPQQVTFTVNLQATSPTFRLLPPHVTYVATYGSG